MTSGPHGAKLDEIWLSLSALNIADLYDWFIYTSKIFSTESASDPRIQQRLGIMLNNLDYSL
jgi:hypothetical protein